MGPSGVPILRPPANALSPGIEWQATQSPARARYSESMSAGLALSPARDVPPVHSRISPQITALETIVRCLNPRAIPAPRFCPPAHSVHRAAPGTDCERFALCRYTEISIHNWQRANALAGCGEDCIGHRSGDWRDGRLARAAPDLSTARHQMDVDPRRICKQHHAIS